MKGAQKYVCTSRNSWNVLQAHRPPYTKLPLGIATPINQHSMLSRCKTLPLLHFYLLEAHGCEICKKMSARSRKRKLGDYILSSKGSYAQTSVLELQQGCQKLTNHKSLPLKAFTWKAKKKKSGYNLNIMQEIEFILKAHFDLHEPPRPLLVPINLLQVPTVVNDLDEVMLSNHSWCPLVQKILKNLIWLNVGGAFRRFIELYSSAKSYAQSWPL